MKKTASLILTLSILFLLVGCNKASSTISNVSDLTEEWETIHVKEDINDYHLPESKAFWNKLTGELVEAVDNEIVRAGRIDIGSQYVGYSVWAGYLFQNGTTLYSVFPRNDEDSVIIVSKDVIDVLNCNEFLNSDAFSNPLLLMKNGSLNGYVTWEGLVDFPYTPAY